MHELPLLDLPWVCNEVRALQTALLTIAYALPRGALREGAGAAKSQQPEEEMLWRNEQVFFELGADGFARAKLPEVEAPSELAAPAQGGEGGASHGHQTSENRVGLWGHDVRDAWKERLSAATSCAELIECLLILESCLEPRSLKPWYRPVTSYMAGPHFLLRLATPAVVAQRLFLLDAAIDYEKTARSEAAGSGGHHEDQHRPTRHTRAATAAASAAMNPTAGRAGRSSRSSRAAAGDEQVSKGRSSRTSRAAAGLSGVAAGGTRGAESGGGASRGKSLVWVFPRV